MPHGGHGRSDGEADLRGRLGSDGLPPALPADSPLVGGRGGEHVCSYWRAPSVGLGRKLRRLRTGAVRCRHHRIDHGRAFLEWPEGKTLPGVEALRAWGTVEGQAGAAPVSEERGADSPARASSSKPSFPLIQKNAHKARHEQRQTDAQDAPHRSCRGSGNARAQRSRTSRLV